jgi:hypothetical protein
MFHLIRNQHLKPNLHLLKQLRFDFIAVGEFANIIINVNHLQSFIAAFELLMGLVRRVESLIQDVAVLVVFDVVEEGFYSCFVLFNAFSV